MDERKHKTMNEYNERDIETTRAEMRLSRAAVRLVLALWNRDAEGVAAARHVLEGTEDSDHDARTAAEVDGVVTVPMSGPSISWPTPAAPMIEWAARRVVTDPGMLEDYLLVTSSVER